jgi:hypothetical protein
MENKKIWIIGDSFTGSYPNAWIFKVCEQFIGEEYYVSSKGSRDTQTIIDIFLRKLSFINSNDFVILFLPTSERVRLPLLNPIMDVEHSNKCVKSIDKEKHLDYFVGSNSYIPTNASTKLEPPLTELNKSLLDSQNYHLNLNLFKIVNTSKASINNFSEIIKSLQSYVPFKLLCYSWTDEYHSDCVIGKSEITSNLGFWETWNDVWQETHGEYGIEGDHHFSLKMHESFANYIIQTNSEYFNQ